MEHGTLYMCRCEQSGGQGSVFEAQFVFKWMNQRGSKQVGDKRI